ncbi:MAG: cytochrome C oxidase subunit IV family protein [Anaerolineae bacterium]
MKHVDPNKEALQPHRYPGSRTYLLVFVGLAILTLIEVAVSYIHSPVKTPLLILLSAMKALLVILFFMHLRYDSRWYAFIFFAPLVLVIPLFWVSLIR